MFTRSRKLVSMLIVFVIVFSYMGQTLEAIATTDGLSAITNGFLNSGEMKFSSYFEEEGNVEKVGDINEKAILTLEIAPNDIGKGFLKEGTITANEDSNFKFSNINNIEIDELEQKAESIEMETQPEEEEVIEELPTISEENNVVEEENLTIDNTAENNTIQSDVVENEIVENEVSQENLVNETENVRSEENVLTNETTENTTNEVTSRSSEPRTENDNAMPEEEFVNEDEIIQNEMTETYEELTAKDFETEIISDNQIKVQNVIHKTKIEVEIEYNKKDTFYIADLYRQINLQLKGTYINIDLKRIETEQNQQITVGWKYHQEFELAGAYSSVSPFKLGEHTGTIVESKITIKRQTEAPNHLPVKQTSLEVEVPEIAGKGPEKVSVQAQKLMATKGEDLGEVNFNQDNWNYDAENKKLTLHVTNEKDGTAANVMGEDEYILVYRYRDYIQENISLQNNIKATIEEYSANETIRTTKELQDTQEIQTKENDLITYNLGTTTQKLNKAKINANYNSQEPIYETEYVSTVNVNILTSDLVEEFKINTSKELYLDSNGTEFDATPDIHYNKVKFNYAEIKNVLQNDATVEIQTLNGNLLYTLTKDSIQNEDACEIKLASQEKGLYIVFKNVSVNGNVSVEFTKGIGKSNYDKATFNSFKQIKSFVSAELKYREFEERYQMAEMSTTKDLENSRTIAELNLTNENLTTIAKNDNVELRIALNNDKQDSDLYINPSFELVFPKYVKNVSVENMNLMYGNGLRIEDFQTYIENEIVKMRIQLAGVQTTFCESVITNGTNILLNLNIELDEYTPKKQDQIKLYYCNEGVTNYGSQTKWTISKAVPNGILKDTNGFDVAIVNYKAPNGFITANGIINYDGQASKVKSISQGEKTVNIGVGSNAQVATMELIAMNNTDNSCADAVFLGRMPFKGNKSVITGKDLNTTTNVNMLGGLQENLQNSNMATIYYSTKEKATKDLNNSQNEWTTDVDKWQDIKSYMIVVKGEIEAGTILKYTYDFEIPANLDYEQAIFGSFGGYYNNLYKTVVSYESTEADKVGLTTQNMEENDTNNQDQEVSSNPIETNEENVDVQVTQYISSTEFNYHDKFEYRIIVENKSNIESYISIDGDLPSNLFLEKSKLIIDGKEEEIPSYNKFSKYEKLTANGKIEIISTGEIIDWGNLNKALDLSNIVTVQVQGEKINSNEINVKIHKTQNEEELEEEEPEEEEIEFEEDDTEVVDIEQSKSEESEEESEKYSISGNVYVDSDGDGFKTEVDKVVKSQIQVQLLRGANMVKATTTDKNGNYTFSDLESGDYSVVYHYDKDNYTSTKYTQEENNEASKAIETEEGISVTDNITLTDTSIENINTGLQEKDKFDFAIKQYVESSIVNIRGEETEYNYDNLELAKIEIKPSDLKDATVKLKYKIVVTNEGNQEGQVTSIVNYLPNGLIFDQAENPDWTIGVIKENVYYDGLKGINIKPGESKEIYLILNKKMSEENTGVISNKVQIAYTESSTRLTESVEGNFATQETIITITQGRHTGLKIVISTISFTGIIGLFGYMVKTGKFEKKFNGKNLIKKVYK